MRWGGLYLIIEIACKNCAHCLITYPCSHISGEDYPEYEQEELEDLWKVKNYQCTYDRSENSVKHSPHVRPDYHCEKFDFSSSHWVEKNEVIQEGEFWKHEHHTLKKK